MRKRKKGRVIATVLAISLLVTSVPSGVYATEIAPEEKTESVEYVGTGENGDEKIILGEDKSLREETVKHFLNSDGSYTAVNYFEPVHYQEESGGEWIDIDNTIVEEDLTRTGQKGKRYVPKASPLDIVITEEEELVTTFMKNGEYQISWSYETSEKGEVNKKAFSDNVSKDQRTGKAGKEAEKVKRKEQLRDGLVHRNVEADVDIERILDGNLLKENILLHTKKSNTEYIIHYEIGELEHVQEDERNIVLYSQNKEEIFRISAPMMQDAAGEMSEELRLSVLEQNGTVLKVELAIDQEWIQAKERVFPVVVDPYVLKATTNSSYDASALYLLQNNYPYGTLAVGNDKGSAVGKAQSYMKFDLPSLKAGDMVTGGNLYVTQYSGDYGYSAVNQENLQINVYMVLTAWNESTIKQSTEHSSNPTRSANVSDYQRVGYTSTHKTINFDVTKIVKEWYEGEANYGICLRADDVDAWALASFIATDNTQYLTERPFLQITYLNNKGLEGRWTYHEQNLGESGSGYVNDYTGNLVYILPITATNGNVMPVNVSLIYNGYQNGQQIDQPTIAGKGWRLNIQQRIIKISSGSTELDTLLYNAGYRYIYEDMDGTAHYFLQKEGTTDTYVDEEGLELTLTISSNSNEKYQLKDADGGRVTFDAEGYLQKAYDTTGDYYAIGYKADGSHQLSTITDGTGRVIRFNLNASGCLTGIIDSAGRLYTLQYNNGELTGLVYPDGTHTTFAWTSGKLSKVVGKQGIGIRYSYPGAGDTATKSRVIKVEEIGRNGNTGQSVDIVYGGNRTSFTDNQGVKTHYIFDHYGRTINIGDSEGATEIYSYTDPVGNNTSNSKKAHLVNSVGVTSDYVKNLLKNHSFESGATDWNLTNAVINTNVADTYLGKQSVKLDGNARISQTVTADQNEFVFSAYAKTSGNTVKAKVEVVFQKADGTVLATAASTTSMSSDWDRLHISFEVPNSAAKFEVRCVAEGTGSAWFDCVQLEPGRELNQYNLIEDGSFERSPGSTWSSANTNSATDMRKESEARGGYYYIQGESTANKYLSQSIKIYRPAKEVYISVSGIAQGTSVPLSDEARKFAIAVRSSFSDGSSKTESFSFNEDYSEGWQRASGIVGYPGDDSSKTVNEIEVRLCYFQNENVARFDNLLVNIDKTGSTYTYDGEGNLISAKDNAGRNETFRYNNQGDILSAVSADNKAYEYTYANSIEHRLLSARSASSGLKFNFGYDDYGNVLFQRIQGTDSSGEATGEYIRATTTYTEDGNYVLRENDARGYGYKYTYDEDKGLVKTVTDKLNYVTTYSYNAQNDYLTGVSSEGTEISYTYNNGQLSKIAKEDTDYLFSYDTYGNLLSTSVGNRTLSTNVYGANNGELSSTTYGNGYSRNYVYDKYGRVTSIKQGGAAAYQFYYNADSQLARYVDIVNGKENTYTYDLQGRLERTDVSDGTSMEYAYNTMNLGTSVTYKMNGIGSRTIEHSYSAKDNLPEKTSVGAGYRISNAYDSLTRLEKKTYETGASDATVEYSYVGYTSAENANRTTGIVNGIYYNTQGSIELKDRLYVYDGAGNITSEYGGTKTASNIREKYTYDSKNQLIRNDSAVQGKSYTYTYDNAGNILSKSTYAYTTGSLGAAEGTVQYTYGDSSWGDLLTAYGGDTISYDAIGNMTAFRGKNFEWEGRSLRHIRSGADSYSYKYNSEGIRTEKNINGTETEFLLEGSQIIAETRNGETIWYYYDSEGNRIGLEKASKYYYYMYNIQGDVIGIVEADTGKVVAAYEYDAWGKCVSINNMGGYTIGEENPFRYRGYYYDAETGL